MLTLEDELFATFPMVLTDLSLAIDKTKTPMAAFRLAMLKRVLFADQDYWQRYEDLMHQATLETLKAIVEGKE